MHRVCDVEDEHRKKKPIQPSPVYKPRKQRKEKRLPVVHDDKSCNAHGLCVRLRQEEHAERTRLTINERLMRMSME